MKTKVEENGTIVKHENHLFRIHCQIFEDEKIGILISIGKPCVPDLKGYNYNLETLKTSLISITENIDILIDDIERKIKRSYHSKASNADFIGEYPKGTSINFIIADLVVKGKLNINQNQKFN